MESSDAPSGPLAIFRPGATVDDCGPKASRFDHQSYVSSTMEFRCNLKCVHCMIEGTMDRLVPQSLDQFHQLLAHNAEHRQWKGLILTGSEITLHRDLPEWARMARRSGFDHVRIQTHGMRLAQPDYCDELVAAGVDEFFVSVCAADALTHDAITQVPGSFDKTLRGLELLDGHAGVTTITNTVVTALNYSQLSAIVERLAPLKRLAQMEFWFYFAMSERDDKQLIPFIPAVRPEIKKAIRRLREIGRGIEVKNFPECLLGGDRDVLYNDQPTLFIDPAFWIEFMRNGFDQCVYRNVCSSRQCLGLNSAYRERFGDHADILKPYKA